MARSQPEKKIRKRPNRKRWLVAELRALRLWVDLSQFDLAEEIGVSDRSVREWERRDSIRIQPRYLAKLDELAEREGFPVDRREVLAGGTAVVTRLVLPTARPRVDERYLARLTQITNALGGAHEAARSGDQLESAEAHLKSLLSLLDGAVSDDVERRLHVLAGRTALVLGLFARDLGQVQRGRLCAEQAVSLARRGGSKGLEALALADLTYLHSPLWVPNGDARLSVEHAEAALAATGTSTPAATRSYVATGLAEACAVGKDDPGMRRALEVAVRALSGPATSEDPGARYFGIWNEAVVNRLAGRCCVLAGRTAEGEVLLRDALANGWIQNDRQLARTQANLGSALALQQRPDEACAELASAHEAARRDGYALGMHYITTARRHLDPWPDHPSVLALDERLRTGV
ncbi:MAG: helix-turn-helix domain-containing protein [Egibacteraceae bacterium]